jgi:hypothetical protein
MSRLLPAFARLAVAGVMLFSEAGRAQDLGPVVGPPPAPVYWGALAFTSSGSYSTAYRYGSKAEAEAAVLKSCTKFRQGVCEVISFQGRLCAALVTYSTSRWRLAFTGGGLTVQDAQKAAFENCKSDRRVRGSCTLRTVVCGDGR